MPQFFEHENHSYQPSISEYGKIRKASKSDFLSCLQEYGSSLFTSPAVTAKVIDGAAAVQCLKPSAAKTVGEYVSNEFKASVPKSLKETLIARVDVIFDIYFPISLKIDTRGSGLRLSVKGNTPIVKNWSKVLKEDSSKIELFNLIAEKITAKRYDGKVVIAKKGMT